MTDTTIARRGLLAAGTLLVAAGAAAASAQTAPALSTAPAAFPVRPLPFDPKSIPGLSEKLLVSHHDNNYAGAVKRLGAIRADVVALDPATAPTYTLNGLKREELIAWNSMILHEIYFAGLSAQPSQPAPALAQALERDFGSIDRWRSEFSGMGKALGGGSGWVVLTYSPHDGKLVNQWAADHTMALAGATPVLVLDMYEHAYQMDYGAKAGAYVEAVMKAVNWSNADAAYARATRT
jgi:superoxide dismutase, Fe-Mn family